MNLRERWTRTSIANRLLVVVGAVAAFGTLVSACFTGLSYMLIHQSAKETSAQVQKVVEAADKAVSQIAAVNKNQLAAIETRATENKATINAANKTASDQLAIQSEAMRLERRAWVAPAQPGRPLIEIGKPVAASIEFMNTGQTPAFSDPDQSAPSITGSVP